MIRLRTTAVGLCVAGLAAACLAIPAQAAPPPAVQEATPRLAPLLGPNIAAASGRSSIVPGSYIVVLKGSSDGLVQSAVSTARAAGGVVGHTFTGVLEGYSATLSSSELTSVRQDPAVKYVQRNLIRHTTGETQKNPKSWGLDRIDQRSLPLTTSYYYASTGRGVTAWVLDTGASYESPDWVGRIDPVLDFTGTPSPSDDCNGHGTHVAGTIGGTTYGVAKGVQIRPVKVLDCQGAGRDDDIISALDWIKELGQHRPAVVNMSLGGVFSQALNDAVQGMIDSGISVVVAAGNEKTDACTTSPASVTGAITVGASTRTDRAASFSNYGPCVDLYAPGENIVAYWKPEPNGQIFPAILSGTSQAAPHVTGVVALYLQSHPAASPAQIADAITGVATKDAVTGLSSSFPNDLLFSLQPATAPAGVMGGDRLQPGENLRRGVRLYSSNGKYFLAHRSSDSLLCLYDATTGKVIWSSGHSGVWTNLHRNGSLNSYDNYGRRSWTSGSTSGSSTMIVNGKGYVMIRRIADGVVTWTTPH